MQGFVLFYAMQMERRLDQRDRRPRPPLTPRQARRAQRRLERDFVRQVERWLASR